jgi:hypothetical protein
MTVIVALEDGCQRYLARNAEPKGLAWSLEPRTKTESEMKGEILQLRLRMTKKRGRRTRRDSG